MTSKITLHDDLFTLERRAQKLRAEAIADGTRRMVAWAKSFFGGASVPARSKTA